MTAAKLDKPEVRKAYVSWVFPDGAFQMLASSYKQGPHNEPIALVRYRDWLKLNRELKELRDFRDPIKREGKYAPRKFKKGDQGR